MIAYTGPDSLRIESASVEVSHLYLIGTISGVIPLLAAARNGPGSGRLASHGDGKWLTWLAPGSQICGARVRCAADGSYLLRDGEDTDKWLRLQVDVSELASGPRQTAVDLSDRYNNPIASDDVTAVEAAAGDVETWTFTVRNVSNAILSQLKVWVDGAAGDLEIADDGAAWVSPTTEAAAIELPDLAVDGTDTLHVRRTIAAGAECDGGVLVFLHFGYFGQ